jgi:hypothetical protein
MKQKRPKWIVDTHILDARNVTGNIVDAIKKAGCDIHLAEYKAFAPKQDYGIDGDSYDWKSDNFVNGRPYCLYGTIGYVQKCNFPLFPGAYGINDNTNCNFYYSHVPADWMLNSDFVMAPFQVIKNNPSRFFDLFGVDDLFIRPNTGRKAFTGYTITRENAAFELSSSMQLTSVQSETICLISAAKNIKSEFRFVIGNGEVIDGSEYRWDRILDIRHDWLSECWDLADKMAKHTWQPDTCYTVDVADTEDGPKIVELNGFSCAGLYACDKNLVFDRVSKIAQEEFYGDLK